MRLLLLLAFFFLFSPALSDEQYLLKATSDMDSRVDNLLLQVDSAGRPTHLLHRKKGKPEKVYEVSRLTKGVVLRAQSGKDVLVLRTTGFDPDRGATVFLQYLYSGVPPAEYRSVKLELKKKGHTWSLFSNNGDKPLKAIHFQTNLAQVLGYQKVIGIRSVKLLH